MLAMACSRRMSTAPQRAGRRVVRTSVAAAPRANAAPPPDELRERERERVHVVYRSSAPLSRLTSIKKIANLLGADAIVGRDCLRL